MDISIIICTYNRAGSLQLTFDSIKKLKIPPAVTVELIVVDNNSNDSTKAVVTKHMEQIPFPARYVFEEKQGLSHARNRGVSEASGAIFAFTDDDVKLDSDWLIAIEKAFRHVEVACTGGKILPIWEKEHPAWLTEDLFKYIALLDLGNDQIQLDEPLIFGANFVIRSSMFGKYGCFETALGRTGGKLYAGEESEFIERVLNGGDKIYYTPDLVVHHYIPEKRMRKAYFRKWIIDNSELIALQVGKCEGRNIVGVPFYGFRDLLASSLNCLKSFLCFNFKFTDELYFTRSLIFILTRIKYRLQ